jgi:hypothetical protein
MAMKSLSRPLVAALLCMTALAVRAQEVPLQFGAFSLTFPSGWAFKEANLNGKPSAMIQGNGPEREKLLVTSSSVPQEVPQEVAEQGFRNMQAAVPAHLGKMAAGNGEVVRPLGREELPGGWLKYSIASQDKSLFSTSYFIQVMFLGPRNVVYFTLEGSGTADEAAARFDNVLSTLRWRQ